MKLLSSFGTELPCSFVRLICLILKLIDNVENLSFVQIYSKASPTQVCRYLGSWKYFPFVTCTFFIFTALYKISLCLLKRIFRANNFGSFLLSQTSSEGLLLSASTGRSLVDNTETLWSVKNLNAINIDLSM